MELIGTDLIWSIAGALGAGAVIGAEREYRASPAGLRTHILVSLSCCLLMLSAVHQMHWLNGVPLEVIRIDPVRMAHGVLTGIGFLCGGVIFREGFNVRGLTTAASLWSTATLGMLFGIGFYELAIFGAVSTVIVLAAVTITETRAPQRRVVHLTARFRLNAGVTASQYGQMLKDSELTPITIDQIMDRDVMEYRAIANGYSEERGQRLASALCDDDRVVGFEIHPQQA